ncbi:hypothetical protein K445DRAFT_92695 [Daldinia sp. EC12]|nr:hypothetical protein K445DRAFT_92695 [Daldinia sp. EC12]
MATKSRTTSCFSAPVYLYMSRSLSISALFLPTTIIIILAATQRHWYTDILRYLNDLKRKAKSQARKQAKTIISTCLTHQDPQTTRIPKRSRECRLSVESLCHTDNLGHSWCGTKPLSTDSAPEELLPPEILAMPFGHVLKYFEHFDGVIQAQIKFFFRQKLGSLEEHSNDAYVESSDLGESSCEGGCGCDKSVASSQEAESETKADASANAESSA